MSSVRLCGEVNGLLVDVQEKPHATVVKITVPADHVWFASEHHGTVSLVLRPCHNPASLPSLPVGEGA